jgi:hypothetical protein
MSRIPKIVHRIWFGDKSIPDEYNKWWMAWQRQLVDYEFITWTDNDIKNLPLIYDKINEARNYAEKSDVARYEIIRIYGGIYLDCDFIPLNLLNIDEIESDFIRIESNNIVTSDENNEVVSIVSCSNGFFAAAPNHPVLIEATRLIKNVYFDKNSDRVDTVQKTGPIFWGKVVDGLGETLPASSLIPYSYEEPFSVIFEKDLQDTFAIHVWGNSWVTHGFQKYKFEKIAKYGDISAMEEISHKTGISQDEYDRLMNHYSILRETRYNITKMCTVYPLANEILSANISPTLYEPYKFFYYIFECRARIIDDSFDFIQIGCSSYEMNQFIRPTIINFDPKLGIIENDISTARTFWKSVKNNNNISIYTIGSGDDDLLRRISDPSYCNLIASSCQKHEVLIISLHDENCLILKSIIKNNNVGRVIIGIDSSKNGVQDIKLLLPRHKVFQFKNIYVAYRVDILYDYCLHLFIEYGIPNIFSKTINYIFPPGRNTAL